MHIIKSRKKIYVYLTLSISLFIIINLCCWAGAYAYNRDTEYAGLNNYFIWNESKGVAFDADNDGVFGKCSEGQDLTYNKKLDDKESAFTSGRFYI